MAIQNSFCDLKLILRKSHNRLITELFEISKTHFQNTKSVQFYQFYQLYLSSLHRKTWFSLWGCNKTNMEVKES